MKIDQDKIGEVYRCGEHNIVILDLSNGKQAFYRSKRGIKQQPEQDSIYRVNATNEFENQGAIELGRWVPFDGLLPIPGVRVGFETERFTEVKMRGTELHDYGTQEFKYVCRQLDQWDMPEGRAVSPEFINELIGTEKSLKCNGVWKSFREVVGKHPLMPPPLPSPGVLDKVRKGMNCVVGWFQSAG